MRLLYLNIVCIQIFVIALILSFVTESYGQKSKKQQTINFEDQLVEGELNKPELFFLLQKKQFNFGRLLKLRENFLPEMRRDATEVERGGAY